VAGFASAVFGAVVDEPEHMHVAVAFECVERHFGRQVYAGLRPAGEHDRGAVTVAQNSVDEVPQPWELAGVGAGDRCLEELLTCVAEHRAPGRVGGEEPVCQRVEDACRIACLLEQRFEWRERRQACFIPST
jgi:hypothetical protein